MVAKRHTETRQNALRKQQRCFSDCTGRNPLITMATTMVDDTSSAVGGDSGIVDYVSTECRAAVHSDTRTQSSRRPSTSRNGMVRTCSLDEGVLFYSNQDNTSADNIKTKQRRGRMTKHLSLSSVGGSSDTLSSLLGGHSVQSMASELLSSLGFGDFDSPELIPDRFIPRESQNAKPSVIFEQTLLGMYSCDPLLLLNEPKVACSIASSVSDPQKDFEVQPLAGTGKTRTDTDLPLGATADNFIANKLHCLSPPEESPPTTPKVVDIPHQPLLDPFFYNYSRKYVQLETVPEETASDLSPSPRWLSPRVSLDHSYYDLSTGQLGSSLSMASRKRSLPNREGYRMSMESLLSEQDSTVYFSVTSYDDDLAREQEREEARYVLPADEGFLGRSRRKGVHDAPPELLTWLQDQHMSVDDEEMPWPFNEQAHIRRSLTEYHYQQRLSRSSSSTLEDRSLSPGCEDPFEGVFQRRFSISGPLTAPSDLINETRRLSLPSKSSYGFRVRSSPGPPSKGANLEPTIDEECGYLR